MNGGPSQLDTWDYKPGLQEYFDKDIPTKRSGWSTIVDHDQRPNPLSGCPLQIPIRTVRDKSGIWVNKELLPFTSEIVDEISLIKTVHTNAINHDPACTFVMTGSEIPGKASIGSWLAYGLGSENDDLPAFVVFTPQFPSDSNGQAIYNRMWGSGFLSTRYNGVALRGSGDPVLYLPNPGWRIATDRRVMLDALDRLNHGTLENFGDPETATRIAQYEMAFRMQASVPDLTDIRAGNRSDSGDVRPRRESARHVCSQRFVVAPIGRTRRASRADSASRLGSTWIAALSTGQSVQANRPGHCGIDQGSQAARACSTVRSLFGEVSLAGRFIRKGH